METRPTRSTTSPPEKVPIPSTCCTLMRRSPAGLHQLKLTVVELCSPPLEDKTKRFLQFRTELDERRNLFMITRTFRHLTVVLHWFISPSSTLSPSSSAAPTRSKCFPPTTPVRCVPADLVSTPLEFPLPSPWSSPSTPKTPARDSWRCRSL